MNSLKNHQTDTAIFSLFAKNERRAWELLYNKYASMIYGIILNMAGRQPEAVDIFKKVFIEIREKKVLLGLRTALCHRLIRHTYILALKNLNVRGLEPESYEPLNGKYPLINLLCFKCVTLKEAAMKATLAEQDVHKKLWVEFNCLRHESYQTSLPEVCRSVLYS